jgi:cytochrome o ubiquinol oxidase subunit III
MTSAELTPGVGDDAIPLSERGPAPKRSVVGFGFWLFLLSDIVIFAGLFATYAVLSGSLAGGPSGPTLFDRSRVFTETLCLLTSSVTCGFGLLAMQSRRALPAYAWMAATFVLGAFFLKQEMAEFAGMVALGAGPTRSAFLSAFYTLVGTHGMHVTVGLAWLIGMFAQLLTLGFQPMVQRRFFCFALFWHALDIVWIGVFTIVYLGAR